MQALVCSARDYRHAIQQSSKVAQQSPPGAQRSPVPTRLAAALATAACLFSDVRQHGFVLGLDRWGTHSQHLKQHTRRGLRAAQHRLHNCRRGQGAEGVGKVHVRMRWGGWPTRLAAAVVTLLFSWLQNWTTNAWSTTIKLHAATIKTSGRKTGHQQEPKDQLTGSVSRQARLLLDLPQGRHPQRRLRNACAS